MSFKNFRPSSDSSSNPDQQDNAALLILVVLVTSVMLAAAFLFSDANSVQAQTPQQADSTATPIVTPPATSTPALLDDED